MRVMNAIGENRNTLETWAKYILSIVNHKVIDKFPGVFREYKSSDVLLENAVAESNIVDTEFLNSLTINNLPLHNLKLKPNCPIMLLRNICPAQGLCNGTRLKVIQLHDHIIEAKITTEGKFY
eukprot:Pgem_evm1s10834